MTVTEFRESPRLRRLAYRLPACHREQEIFQTVDPLTLRSSLRSLRLRLYDEESRRLVGYQACLYEKSTA